MNVFIVRKPGARQVVHLAEPSIGINEFRYLCGERVNGTRLIAIRLESPAASTAVERLPDRIKLCGHCGKRLGAMRDKARFILASADALEALG